MNDASKQYEVVVVGGGFAGIEAVQALSRQDLPVHITFVSNKPCFQYYPNLYRLVVGATVNQVSIPLTKIVPNTVTLMQDTYTAIDQTAHTVTLESGKTLPYNFLVLALGSEPNYFGIDGMEAKSKSFLSIEKALALRNYFSDLLLEAKSLSIEEAKMRLHTIIVGAGPSGVELAGALPTYLRKQAKRYGVDPALITVDLLDSSPRVLPAIPERASLLVQNQLKKKGVTLYPNHGVNSCDENCIVATEKIADKEEKKEFKAGTIIWTAGTKISSAFATIPNVAITDRKRIQVTPTLTLPNDERVYIAGDGAGTPFSGLAQTAIDQGQFVGMAITKAILEKPIPPYEPKQGIFVIPVGRFWAILNYKNFVMYGIAPWFLRIFIDARYFLSITSHWHVLSMLKKEAKEMESFTHHKGLL